MSEKLKRFAHVCQFCGKEFSSARSDTRFCCDAHRLQYFRWATKLQAHSMRVHRQLAMIADYLQFSQSKQQAEQILQSIRTSIRNILTESEKHQ